MYEDLCELANQRQTDYSHFIREFVIEVMIVIALLAEVGLVAVDLWNHWE